MSIHYDHPALPADFPEKCAYMRLYGAHVRHDQFWPAAMFGDEIRLLLGRSHAEPFGAGYRLTEAGIAHWEAHVQAWQNGTLPRPPMGRTPVYWVLLDMLRDEAWHATSELCVGRSREHTIEVCQRLYRQGYANRQMKGGWLFQITPDGLSALMIFEQSEAAS